MQATHSQTSDVFWDLTKATIASLALIGIGGCAPGAAAKIESRPTVTPDEVLNSPSSWIGKEISVQTTPRFLSDNSTLIFDSRRGRSAHLKLDLDIRYALAPKGGSSESYLVGIDSNRYDVCNERLPIKDLSRDYRLQTTTYVVSGTIKKFSNSEQVYLDIDASLYQSTPKN